MRTKPERDFAPAWGGLPASDLVYIVDSAGRVVDVTERNYTLERVHAAEKIANADRILRERTREWRADRNVRRQRQTQRS